MRPTVPWHRRLRAAIAATVLGLFPPSAEAEDRVLVRGNYYREASTRVLEPTLVVSTDLPDERFTLGAGYMLDAISSASIASGTQEITGGDNVFTEIRHEATLFGGSRIGEWRFGGSFRYSTETDYISRGAAVNVSRDVWQRSGTVSAAYSYTGNSIFRNTSVTGNREPWRSTGETNLLQVHYLTLGYSHALLPTLLAGVSVEGVWSDGPQDNPYRGAQIINGLAESHPLVRRRLAVSGSVNWLIPRTKIVLEPRYRYYVDDWDIHAHMSDNRIHFRLGRHLILRLRYRYYTQTQAFFWRDDGIYSGDPDAYRSADPKMDAWHSHTPGAQLVIELDRLARVPGLGWLERAWIEATYNHVFQTNRYGDARLGDLAFSLAF